MYKSEIRSSIYAFRLLHFTVSAFGKEIDWTARYRITESPLSSKILMYPAGESQDLFEMCSSASPFLSLFFSHRQSLSRTSYYFLLNFSPKVYVIMNCSHDSCFFENSIAQESVKFLLYLWIIFNRDGRDLSESS